MTLDFTIHKAVPPSALAGQPNGGVDSHLLDQVDGRTDLVWLMAALPARCMRAMHGAFHRDTGLTLASTGRGRTYAQQVLLFDSRYTLTPLAGRPTKTWNGKTYYQKPGTAMAAVPGTSNHGLWCADDLAELSVDGRVLPLSAPALEWLTAHAPEYGFAWDA